MLPAGLLPANQANTYHASGFSEFAKTDVSTDPAPAEMSETGSEPLEGTAGSIGFATALLFDPNLSGHFSRRCARVAASPGPPISDGFADESPYEIDCAIFRRESKLTCHVIGDIPLLSGAHQCHLIGDICEGN